MCLFLFGNEFFNISIIRTFSTYIATDHAFNISIFVTFIKSNSISIITTNLTFNISVIGTFLRSDQNSDDQSNGKSDK